MRDNVEKNHSHSRLMSYSVWWIFRARPFTYADFCHECVSPVVGWTSFIWASFCWRVSGCCCIEECALRVSSMLLRIIKYKSKMFFSLIYHPRKQIRSASHHNLPDFFIRKLSSRLELSKNSIFEKV